MGKSIEEFALAISIGFDTGIAKILEVEPDTERAYKLYEYILPDFKEAINQLLIEAKIEAIGEAAKLSDSALKIKALELKSTLKKDK